VHSDESRTQGLDRLELIRFLQVSQTITVHHGAVAYLLGINAQAADVELDVGALDPDQRIEPVAVAPLEPAVQLVGVELMGVPGVAGQE